MFPYFWCQTFSVSRRALDPDPVRILTDPDPGWCSRSRASMERMTKRNNTKKRTCKLSRKLTKWFFEYLSQVRTSSPGYVSGSENRILSLEKILEMIKQCLFSHYHSISLGQQNYKTDNQTYRKTDRRQLSIPKEYRDVVCIGEVSENLQLQYLDRDQLHYVLMK